MGKRQRKVVADLKRSHDEIPCSPCLTYKCVKNLAVRSETHTLGRSKEALTLQQTPSKPKPNETRTPLCAKLSKKTQVRTTERLVVEKSELQLLCFSYQPPFETKAKPRNCRSFSTSTAGHQEKPKRQDPSEARD
ncbi:hypothetical protein V6N13_123681 [Hibiscus sabdariffa]|uniref:Uncharacterized protein n=1 Tax=Hibiscus sabdariffa TaxID=183260 RepID=A0ABR2QU29_9ROSI